MRKFENQVQLIKYKVLKEVAKRTLECDFQFTRHKIPKAIIPGHKPITRCCVYKEREIVGERIELASDPVLSTDYFIEVLDIACDECPVDKIKITEACRGCLAHKCIQVCPRNAIEISKGRAEIHQESCVECGRCIDVCPFNAISNIIRPCKKACASSAIEIKDNQKAEINREKCTSCGACVYQCPFGAIEDRAEIIPVIEALKSSKKTDGKDVYAVIAPAIAIQYNTNIGQVVSAIKKMGFKDVVEVALGADMVAYNEALEFVDRIGNKDEPCMMTSCCPAFVSHIQNNHKELSHHISTMVSPMIAISRFIRKTDPNSIIVFVGPCTAKKEERRQTDIQDATDYVITFEELDALLDAYGIIVSECEDQPLENVSRFGRVFAKSGGVSGAVAQVIKEENIENIDFNPIICSGINEIDKALRLLKMGKLPYNFIEGMACKDGCIGGSSSLTHEPKSQKLMDKYADLAMDHKVKDTIEALDLTDLELHRHI